MTHQEKRAWTRLFVAVLAYAVYALVILSRAHGSSLATTPYVWPLLWTIVGGTVAGTMAETAIGTATPRAARTTDIRDRQIGRLGDSTGHAFVIIGAVAAMLMAMAGWDRFWIANVVYLCFTLSAVVGGIAKVVVYRRGMPQW